jgi:hypothetical protein
MGTAQLTGAKTPKSSRKACLLLNMRADAAFFNQ